MPYQLLDTTVMIQDTEVIRVCYNCKSTYTYKDKYGYEHWHKDDNRNIICYRCYSKLYFRLRKGIWNRLPSHREQNKKRITFMSERLILDSNPRIGVCNLCRAVVGFDCKKTHLHHEAYDRNNPLAHTMEVCVSCHIMISKPIRGKKRLFILEDR